ncbi:MAG: TolC family protein [Verrucomicrobiales bacterium]|nr:TolC family protein [Verrucomicrobiales bacterium]
MTTKLYFLSTAYTLAFFNTASAGNVILSLNEANARALEKHPSLAVFDADRRMADAKILSALAIPNPEIDFETEDVLGSGEYEGFQSAVYNLGLSQLLELGGKRRQRAEVATSLRESEDLRFEAARREVMLETTRRFVAALASQEAEGTAGQNLAIAKETVDSVKGLQEGGRGSVLDVGQSELGLREAQLQVESARSRSKLARQQLASLWGDSKPDFERVSGKLTNPVADPPSVESLDGFLDEHPLMAMARSGISTAKRELNLQERLRQPDLNLGVAWRRDTTVDDNAVVLNFSLPLPLWNKNEGGIAEAEAGIARSEALVSQARLELSAALAEAVARLEIARSQYQLVADQMLPAAAKHHEAVSEGYRLGRISYLELLEARRALTQVRGQRIEMLSGYHLARVEIEALTGKAL